MYTYKNRRPLDNTFGVDKRLELIMKAGIDGELGENWEDKNGAITATGFFTYLLGKPSAGDELDAIISQACPYCVIPKSDEWRSFIEKLPRSCYTRYKMLPPNEFDIEKLESFVNALPKGFSLIPIDHELLDKGIVTPHALNIPHVYGSAERYLAKSFGFAVTERSRSVSVVSAYIVHDGEAEVDISTDENYRRRGFAAALCAKFVLECLERGLIPSWDAQNLESVKLAEKLGFSLDHPYEAYVLKK